jgi:hypothetical protein
MNTQPWSLHPEALAELDAAGEWYDGRDEGLGEDFVDSVYRALHAAMAQQHPGTVIPYVRRNDVRWLLMTPRFPYGLVLLLDPRVVIAVAHLHRRPGYWKKRLPPRSVSRARIRLKTS